MNQLNLLLKDLYLLTRSKLNKEPLKASSQISIERQKNVIDSLDAKKEKEFITHHFKNFEDNYFNKNSSSSLLWQSKLILKNKNKIEERIKPTGLKHKVYNIIKNIMLNALP